MTLEKFHEELSTVDASRGKRSECAKIVLSDIRLLPKLLDVVFQVDDKRSYRAAWVLEFVCDANIYTIIPHLDSFTSNLKNIHFDSAVRPLAKICMFIAKAYHSKQPNTLRKALNSQHKELLIEACFDWLINDEKTAPKAYAMETLFLFGNDDDWIHPELVKVLRQNFHSHSPGYKARAKQILQKLNKSYDIKD